VFLAQVPLREVSRPVTRSWVLVPSPAMQAEMLGHLTTHSLSKFEEKLCKLGASKLEDIQYLRDDDLTSIGMNVVQIRKLQSTNKPAKKAWDKKVWDDDDDDDNDDDGDKKEGFQPDRQDLARQMRSLTDPPSFATKERKSIFWQEQAKGRPKRLIFIRHGESEANVMRSITASVPDHSLHLTAKGREQALDAGRRLKELIGEESATFIVSPYVRARETLNGILWAWDGVKPPIRQDLRIREQEYGNFDSPDIQAQHKEKKLFGPFYYRFPNGESPADCFDRASSFIESLYRSWQDNTFDNYVIVGHGMMILVTLMRLLCLSVEEFMSWESLENCEFIVLERPVLSDPKFKIAFTLAGGGAGKHVGDLRKKTVAQEPPAPAWDGDPSASLLTNLPVTGTGGYLAAGQDTIAKSTTS